MDDTAMVRCGRSTMVAAAIAVAAAVVARGGRVHCGGRSHRGGRIQCGGAEAAETSGGSRALSSQISLHS
jgi:hypothetical protein